MFLYIILSIFFVLCNTQNCTSIYRTFDGTCNNPNNANVGKAGQAFTRLGFPTEPFIAGDLPLPRTISNAIGKQQQSFCKLTNKQSDDESISMFEPGFGQFVIHDIMFGVAPPPGSPTTNFNDLTNDEVFGLQASYGLVDGVNCTRAPYNTTNPPFPTNENDTNIPLPPCNPFNPVNAPIFPFLPLSLRIPNFTRVGNDPNAILNDANSWLDLSQIYGNSDSVNAKLRNGAKLKLTNYVVSQGAFTPLNFQGTYSFEFLPNTLETGLPGDRILNGPFNLTGELFTQGDWRAGENVMIGIQHYIWTKEHNFQVDRLQAANPEWSTEKLFQEARRFTIAVYQRVIYQEWLPQILDKSSSFFIKSTPSTYSPDIDPTTSLITAVAASRYGHSTIRAFDQLNACNQQPFRVYAPSAGFGGALPTFYPQGNRFLEPNQVFGIGQTLPMTFGPFPYGNISPARAVASGASSQQSNAVANFIVSSMVTPAAEVDTCIVDELRNVPGLVDLFSTDIYRSRETGLPKYNAVLKEFTDEDLLDESDCEDPSALECFEKLTDNPTVAQALKNLYGNITRVELIVGLLAEKKDDEYFGDLTREILIKEFRRKRDSDFFFYDRDRSSDIWNYASTRPFKAVLADHIGLVTTSSSTNKIFRIQSSGVKLHPNNPACSS